MENYFTTVSEMHAECIGESENYFTILSEMHAKCIGESENRRIGELALQVDRNHDCARRDGLDGIGEGQIPVPIDLIYQALAELYFW